MPPDTPFSEAQCSAVREMLAWVARHVWGTQSATGDQFGVTQEYVSQVIRGRRPVTAEFAYKLAQKIRVPLEDLLSGTALKDAALGLVAQERASRSSPREKAIRALAVLRELTIEDSRKIFDKIGLVLRTEATAEEWLAEGLAQYSRDLLDTGARRLRS